MVTAATPTAILAQGRAVESTRPESRSWAVAPTVRLTNVGWDDNVHRVSQEDGPIGDFTTTFIPAVQASLRASAVQVTGRSEIAFVYFKNVSHYRSIDMDSAARVEVRLGRTTPYVGGDWISARHRRNFEIDLPARRVDTSWNGGVDLQLSGKTSIGVMTRRSRLEYTGDTIYLDSDLARVLGATAATTGVRVRYALTPLTAVGAEIEKDQAEFPATANRNSEGVRVTSVVEFQPRALVSGRVQVGFRRRSFLDAAAPPFRGTVARVDLAYTLLGRTRFSVTGQRDLSYSYRADERDYLLTGLEMAVTQRVGGAWDIGGRLGRFGLRYGLGDLNEGRPSLQERVISYGVDVGFRLDRTRVGFQLSRQKRTSDFSTFRGYEAMQIGSSVSYGF
jgi:hypothetical protein